MCGFSFTQTGNEDTMVKIKGNRQSVRFPVWDYGTHLGGWDSGRIRTDAASAHRGNCYLQQGGCSVSRAASSPLASMRLWMRKSNYLAGIATNEEEAEQLARVLKAAEKHK